MTTCAALAIAERFRHCKSHTTPGWAHLACTYVSARVHASCSLDLDVANIAKRDCKFCLLAIFKSMAGGFIRVFRKKCARNLYSQRTRAEKTYPERAVRMSELKRHAG